MPDGGDCDFIVPDDGSLTPEHIVWSEQASPRVLRATRLADPNAPKAPAVDLAPAGDVYRLGDDAQAHARWSSTGAHHLVVESAGDAPINAVVLPLDDAFELRLDAARHLWRELKGRRPAPAYGALPRQSKTRHILNLRAHDGRRSGAPQRQIAETLFAHTPMASRDWRDHPLRHKVRAILRRADRMVAGGYLDLLFYPGKAPR
ncbi:DUF2285 domain-containing protein [Mesorhizobium sp. IMUNJ 23232]|uniref:DUF2285 domain-containing protein n=1 Tax=Mesorhizobium sp. IMUNJ 23232 TaxID=3376064 RepID=UPI003793FE64